MNQPITQPIPVVQPPQQYPLPQPQQRPQRVPARDDGSLTNFGPDQINRMSDLALTANVIGQIVPGGVGKAIRVASSAALVAGAQQMPGPTFTGRIVEQDGQQVQEKTFHELTGSRLAVLGGIWFASMIPGLALGAAGSGIGAAVALVFGFIFTGMMGYLMMATNKKGPLTVLGLTGLAVESFNPQRPGSTAAPIPQHEQGQPYRSIDYGQGL